MSDSQTRFARLAFCLLLLNAVAVFWIRHELLSRDEQRQQQDIVYVASTIPAAGEQADSAEKLSIVFDQEVGPPTELNQQLGDVAPFLICPQVSGHWNWASGRQLDFVLDEPLPAGRRFEVVTAEGIETRFPKAVQVDHEIEFRTRPLRLEKCRLVTSDRSEVTFELAFNQKVSPDELKRMLTVRDSAEDFKADPFVVGGRRPDRRLLKVTSLVEQPDQSLLLRCRRPKSGQLQIRLAAELTGHEADDGLGEVVLKTLKVSPLFAFLRSDVEESRSDGFWHVDLYFTSGLDGDQQLPVIEVSPRPEHLRTTLASTWRADGRLLRVSGKFESGRSYRVTVPQTLLSESQRPLGEDVDVRFRIPDRAADVEFPNGNGILSTNGNLEVELQTVNVGGLEVRASRVHANNLVAHLHGEWQRQTSRSLGEKSFRLSGARNESVSQVVALRDLLEEPSGLYRLEARATDHSWTRDSTLVTVTDLGLTLKQSDSELLVWVTSLRRATPVEGVRVRSVSYNNQTLAEGVSGADGVVRLPVNSEHPDGRPWVVIAELAGDSALPVNGDVIAPESDQVTQLAWLQIGESQQVLDDVDQSGRAHPDVFDVMLFSDRGTYRPGETIRLTGILRDESGRVPPAFPVNVDVVRPDGRTVLSQTVTADAIRDGVLSFEYATPETTYTGPWRFRLLIPGSSETLVEEHVFVEEFIPVRLQVQAAAQKSLVTGDEVPVVDVDSRYLFGTAAAGLAVRGHVVYSATRFRSAVHPEHRFGPAALAERHDVGDVAATLDAAGHGQLPLPDVPTANRGLWTGDVSVTVTEDGGRSVSARARTMIDTLDRHVGVKLAAVVPVATDVSVDVVLRDARDQSVTGEVVSLELAKIDRENVLQRSGGEYRWERVERVTPVAKWDIELQTDESMVTPLNISEVGSWRLVVTHLASGSRTEFDFIASQNGDASLAAAVNRPGRLDVVLDQTTCQPGESVAANISVPHAGTMLVCLESDRVLWSQVVEVGEAAVHDTSASVTVAIAVPDDLRGGAFVSATLLRAVDPASKQWLPHRASGLARLMTDHSEQRLPVAISAASKAEPRSVVRVEVSTTPGAQVLLWAVDEGILATSAFTTPAPHEHFFAPRKLSVTTCDVYSRLLPDHRRPDSLHRIGGDFADDGDGIDRLRRNPVPTKRRDAAVIWNGLKQADDAGRFVAEVTLPDFTGELRWMAVAISSDRFGSTDQAMTVTAPLLVEASWPRFAAPADRFSVPVKLFNATDEAVVAEVDIEVSGPAVVTRSGGFVLTDGQIASPQDADVLNSPKPAVASIGLAEVPARGSRTVWFDVSVTEVGEIHGEIVARIQSALGSGKVFAAGSEKQSLRQQFNLPVRPGSPLVTKRQFMTVVAGAESALSIPEQFADGSARVKVTIAAEPGLDLKPALDHLIDYPYGCVEQTTSRVRALLAAGRLLIGSENGESDATDENSSRAGQGKAVESLLDAGVARLWAMQTNDGGLSYWPGHGTSNLWGSVYAAESLMRARADGIFVDDRFLKPLTEYLADRLQKPDGEEVDSNLQAEICCVLSQGSQPPIGWMSVLSERLDDLDMAGRAQLALAWHHAGRRDRAILALPDGTIDLIGESRYSGRFSSLTIGRARLLSALLEIDAEHAWIPRLVTELQVARANGKWLSTLENALVIDGLAMRQRLIGDATPFDGTVQIGDREVRVKPGEVRVLVLSDAIGNVPVLASGEGEVSIEVAVTGIPNGDETSPAADVDQGLRVRRRWLDRNGDLLNRDLIRVGDLVVVELTLTSAASGTIDSISIVDALPAGFEVENPRLQTSDADYANAVAGKDRAEFLDDRVVVFASATPSGTIVRYALRAITSGEFVLPPVQAACMYNESLMSVSGAGRVRVREIRNGGEPKLVDRPEDGDRR
jgi:alpha-2-macroglobulin